MPKTKQQIFVTSNQAMGNSLVASFCPSLHIN